MLDNINGGRITLKSDDVQTQALYSCNSGYSMNGGSVLICRSDGSWDISPPSCSKLKTLLLQYSLFIYILWYRHFANSKIRLFECVNRLPSRSKPLELSKPELFVCSGYCRVNKKDESVFVRADCHAVNKVGYPYLLRTA